MEFSGQWADGLLALERLHLTKLAIWGALSVLTGTTLLAWLRLRRRDSPLLLHFGIQTLGWGLVDLALVLWSRAGLALRDRDAAVALDRFVWFNVGLDVGYVAVGVTLAVCGWTMGRRAGLVGAGLGVVVQGLALAVLDLQLGASVVR